MRIEEIAPGQEITLIARIGEDVLEFPSVAQEALPSKHMILVDVVRRDDKILTFRARNLVMDLNVAPPDSAPLVFRNVTINLRKKHDNTLCYAIETVAEAKLVNRRQSFRCFLGFPTSAQCGANHSTFDVILHDISSTGFSVTVSGDRDLRQNQVIHVLLNDYFEESAERFTFHLYGIIVRKHELESGMLLYGCRLNAKVQGLDSYIMKKERIRLRRNSGY